VAVAPDTRGSLRKNPLLETFAIVVVAVGLALLIQAVLVKPFRIPSESMVPTLDIGQRVLVDRVSYRFGEPDRGDIVVFKPPIGAEDAAVGVEGCGTRRPQDQPCPKPTGRAAEVNFIKRVIAVPGDRISVRDGRVLINGRPQNEPFARLDRTCPICDLPRRTTVPADHFFMMGDNRGESDDSREWGPVPKRWIVGRAFFTYWPPNRIGPF
jgi:signal peptidase I